MTKLELIREFSEKTGVSLKESREKLDVLQEIFIEKIKIGEDIVFMDLGKFETRETKAREGRNPKTQEVIQIEAGKKVAYSSSKLVKDTVNGRV